MNPIATYSERRFDGERTFELRADAIVVTGTMTFAASFQTRVPLASLDPNPSVIRVRHSAFWAGFGMALVSLLAREVFVGPLQMPWSAALPGLSLCFCLAGLAQCVATLRKVEFVRFTTHAGVVVLDVARAGPERAAFDSFVSAIVKQVHAAAAAGGAGQAAAASDARGA